MNMRTCGRRSPWRFGFTGWPPDGEDEDAGVRWLPRRLAGERLTVPDDWHPSWGTRATAGLNLRGAHHPEIEDSLDRHTAATARATR